MSAKILKGVALSAAVVAAFLAVPGSARAGDWYDCRVRVIVEPPPLVVEPPVVVERRVVVVERPVIVRRYYYSPTYVYHRYSYLRPVRIHRPRWTCYSRCWTWCCEPTSSIRVRYRGKKWSIGLGWRW